MWAQNPVPSIASASPTQALAGTAESITLTGSGFVSGTVILVNGTAVRTTYVSATSVTVWITAPAGSSANLSVQAQNPAPGGGTSAAVQMPVATVSLVATDPDGTNTGTAQLGVPVNFVAVNTDTDHPTISWSVTGAGSIAYSGTNRVNGTYTPPQTMPSNPVVTVTAAVGGLPSFTTSYTFNLINPTLTVTSSSPTQLLTGGAQVVDIYGSGFLSGATISLNGTALKTTYVSYADLQASVTVAANATGSLNFQVQNPSGFGPAVPYTIPIAANSIAIAPTSQTGPVVQLGNTIKLAATVSGSVSTGVTWSINGAGTFSSSGSTASYVAPTAMPSGGVSITATLTSNPSITKTYSVSLAEPAPALASSNPTQALAGATAPITLTGTGFSGDTVVLVNGVAVPTTYQSATSVIAQITGAAGAAATNLSVQAQNPSPGGGTSTAIQLPVATLQLTATDPDGTNTGTAQLGVPVSIATTNTDVKTSISWTLQGAGTFGSSSVNGAIGALGTYTPPQTMPSNPNVTITAYVTSVPALTTTYTLTLINPALTVTSANPTQVKIGGTQPVTLTGTGFVAGTTISLNGTALPYTYVSYTHATIQVPVDPTATGSLTLQVQNPSPESGSPVSYLLPVAVPVITLAPTSQTGNVVPLGGSIKVGSSVTGSVSTSVTWSVNGAGSITNGGTYNAPTIMPSGSVAVVASLTTNPAITATYPVSLADPVPTLTATNPSQALAGGTASYTVTGTGLVPNTSILVNGVAVPTVYQSPTSVVAQISGPAGATSSLSVQALNPAPGGGTSAAIQMPVATLQVSASDPVNGTNSTTATLGVPVSLSAANTDTTYLTAVWSLQGGGTLTASGTNNLSAVYTPPIVMPSNSSVTITVSLQNQPALSTSYTFALNDPVPTVTSATPTQLQTGGTQTVTLTGTGFVSGTTVLFNKTSLPITYTSYTQATVQVPVAANATGNLTLQVQNPAPGGGSGTTFTESVAPVSITLTANGEDGTNTNFAQLDFPVAMSATVAGSMQTGITWSLVGAGSISSSGVYTAPSAIPTNPAVTINAALTSNTAITSTYSMTIVNPLPTVSTISPNIINAGSTTPITVTGSGFVPATVIQVNGANVPTTYVSPTSVVASVTAAPTATGSLPIQASSPTPNGGTSGYLSLAVSAEMTLTSAGRLLDQTTFGSTTSLIQHVRQEGANAWLYEQFNAPQTVLPTLPLTKPSWCTIQDCFESNWWQTIVTGNDQLRQRVAFALGQLFVTSSDTDNGYMMQTYANTLAQDAYSNWYTIMTDVTLSPAMGYYLNMLNSAKPTATLIANENFARENMQLFNLGLNLLNQDGTPQLDSNGNLIPTYTEAQVEAFARAFTGYTYANADGSVPSSLTWTANNNHPMVAVEWQHDESSKTLLNGTVLPAGQTAEADVAGALTNIFQHPNLPPFVSKQLIQHLVKSNPTPDYISRVSAVFTNNGNNVRGDMQAVLTAIFTDPEARAGDTAQQPGDGHLREPILWLTGVMRALGYTNIDPNNYWDGLSSHSNTLNERPYAAPSVFNFFPPGYVIPGTSINAPEFALENTGSVADRLSQANTLVFNRVGSFNVDMSATSPLGQIAASQGPAALVGALNNLFLYGTMDANTSQAITSEISTVTNPATQLRLAVYLVVTSPEYLVLH